MFHLKSQKNNTAITPNIVVIQVISVLCNELKLPILYIYICFQL